MDEASVGETFIKTPKGLEKEEDGKQGNRKMDNPQKITTMPAGDGVLDRPE